MPNRRFRRGIYLLPTLFTVGNLFCGFSSVLYISLGKLETAAILIVIAGVLDALDGRIARLTGTTSDFGLEFDSLADLVSFGVAPSFLAFQWALLPLGRLGWLVALLFVVCAAMRLARFNLRTSTRSKKYFAGIPSPMAAGLIAAVVFAFPTPPGERWVSFSMGAIVVCMAALMVSTIRYRSFKDLDLRNRRSYIYVLAIAAILAAILTHPKSALLVMASLYALWGPVGYLWGLVMRLSSGSPVQGEIGGSADEVADEPTGR